jgi:hypothetical protein
MAASLLVAMKLSDLLPELVNPKDRAVAYAVSHWLPTSVAFNSRYIMGTIILRTALYQTWLKHYATSRNVAGSMR